MCRAFTDFPPNKCKLHTVFSREERPSSGNQKLDIVASDGLDGGATLGATTWRGLWVTVGDQDRRSTEVEVMKIICITVRMAIVISYRCVSRRSANVAVSASGDGARPLSRYRVRGVRLSELSAEAPRLSQIEIIRLL
ncbi:hypothetical protein EVAR_70036_1 [Eumeta japonica]|uniref:Uncharacterized protein n=1 Tax=Eumeta variegata TaxID=151549 RepID=A0A4C2ABC8_EUMVA|nr:hypothetical protein EVAR_70036_1 [Eumeta japonica]